jgi:glycosyltransferase involved in cell wall biosynthesis
LIKVSVITVTYNSEAYIAHTIESVLKQDYESIEYWIIDGASTDKTVEIAREYSGRFQEKGWDYHIVSESDAGIYDAMNKGIRLATGNIIGIINSEDSYEPDAVKTAVNTFDTTDCEIMFGNLLVYKTNGHKFVKRGKLSDFYQTSRNWNHPTMFVKSELYKQYPFENKGIHDDYAFYLKMRRQNRKVVVVDKQMAIFRMGGTSNKKGIKAAWKRMQDRYHYCYRENGYSRWYFLECLFIEAAKWILG